MKMSCMALLYALLLSTAALAVEPYAFVGLGATRIDQGQASDAWRGKVDTDTSFAWQAGAGLQLNEHFAVEMSWMDFGKISAAGNGVIFVNDGTNKCCVMTQHGDATANLAGIAAAVVLSGRYGSLSPHLKMGAFYNTDTHDIHFTRADRMTYSISHGNAVSPVLGVGLMLTDRLSFDYTWLRELNAWGPQDMTIQALTLGYRWP